MKKIFFLCFVLITTSCFNNQKRSGNNVVSKKSAVIDIVPHHNLGVGDTIGPAHPLVKYSDKINEAFLDSIGHLPTQTLADKTAFFADSIFRSQVQMDTTISQLDFKILKKAALKGCISLKAARRIFGDSLIDSSCNEERIFKNHRLGLIAVQYYSFDKDKKDFNEYAICIGVSEHCENGYVYFFKRNKIISKRNVYSRYEFDLKQYKDKDGNTVFYYVFEFDDGSGIWWNNFFFYKYEGDKIIPILNEVQNANLLQPSPWGARELWLESTVQKTHPLTIKMVYHQKLPDTLLSDTDNATKPDSGPMIVNDSTIVKYVRNGKTKQLEGQFAVSKITRAQILTYYLVDNERLFMNTNYKKLKALLLDQTTRKATLNYINLVKNYSK